MSHLTIIRGGEYGDDDPPEGQARVEVRYNARHELTNAQKAKRHKQTLDKMYEIHAIWEAPVTDE